MAIETPPQQAGILSFYDAPEKGPNVGVKGIVILVLVFVIVIVVLDHFAAL